MRRSLYFLAATLVVAGCVSVKVSQLPAPKPELGAWGVDLTAMDTKVKPGDNFFNYVNGTCWRRPKFRRSAAASARSSSSASCPKSA